ncbi:MAG: asparagine synthase (glutamine-hydrolyzing) [Terriglobia bacterium]
MCGICGIFNYSSGAPVDADRLGAATQALAHRGPDDQGLYIDRELGLGNRRLSIIDLAGGHQPLSNEDESLWITLNGEIYNYRELRAQLEARGHRFRTATDTEAILHLYEEHGLECLQELRGMFAFALWDSKQRRLFLARDRLGVKPLFYRISPQGFTFASELRALRALRPEAWERDPQAIYDFFAFRYVPAPRTHYRDVHKLLPGHYLLVDSKGAQTRCYWDVPLGEDAALSETELAHQTLDCLREAVKLRLAADVPIGAFLSGGTDSSAIVSLMAELGARPLRTFSVGFDGPAASELPYARLVAQKYSTEHQEIIVRAVDVAEDLPKLISLRDEPIAEPSDVALYRLALLAARSVKVALAGEGGDELFAGYPKYAAEGFAGWTRALPLTIINALSRHLPYGARRAQLALETLALRDPAERAAAWFVSFSRLEREALFNREFLAEVDAEHPTHVFREALERNPARSRLKRLLYADLKIWLPDNLLLRGDHMTMAASLEERVPLLDHRLVELAARIPDQMLVGRLRTKTFYRRMLSGQIPAEVLQRPKAGFTVPVDRWFRTTLRPMVEDLLLSPRVRDYFNAANVERFVHEHLEGVRDRRKQIWALLNFELWRRNETAALPQSSSPESGQRAGRVAEQAAMPRRSETKPR